MPYTDEELCAFIDGELHHSDRAAMIAALREDHDLQARLVELQSIDERLRKLYGPLADQPIPRTVTELFEFRRTVHAAGELVPGGKGAAIKPFVRLPTVLAACVALVIGVAIGHLRAPDGGDDEHLQIAANVGPGDALFAVLETRVSGDAVRLDADGDLFAGAVLSFEGTDGRRCREFFVSDAEDGLRGIACRSDKAWEILIAVKSGTHDVSRDQYRTASAESDRLFSVYLDGAMAGDAFGPDEEQTHIAQGWVTNFVD